MWTPFTIAIILVILITTIFLSVLEKRNKIKQKTMVYRIIEIIGIYIPILIFCGYYGYIKTDNLKDTVIVISGFYLCFTLLDLFVRILSKSKYNFIILPIITLVCLVILNYITPYMLSSLDATILSSFIGSTIWIALKNCKHKGKIIISYIVSFLIIIVIPIYYSGNNKVEKAAIEYIESLGYDITDDDSVLILSDTKREEPIHLSIIRLKEDENLALERHIKMVYFKGEIIEFSEKKEIRD